ncbi:MAG TPA: DinB family protein [Thermoanaerobaculia bacterium]|nr:DinB family protein [Thermoanaerobaculia bacterium]
MDRIDRFRRWFDYEKDSHRKVLSSLGTVPPEGLENPNYQKALDLAAHLVAARWLWLFRFGIAAEGPTDIFPAGVPLADLASRFGAMHTAWDGYLAKLEPAELDRNFEYTALDGKRYRNQIEDVLTQLFGHSWYHRGQIALLVRSLGGTPAVTDLVFWTRVPV